MIVLAWNYCGIGNASTVRTLRDLLISHKPSFIFLSKTKCNCIVRLCSMVNKLGFCNMEFVPANGYAGGLMLFWNDAVDIYVTLSNGNIINCLVMNDH